MELLEYFDENNEKILGIEEREFIHDNNLWHREVAVWVVNEKNELLLERRSPNKKQGANKLSIVAGHVDAKEEEVLAAKRELSEEVGLDVSIDELTFIGSYKNEKENNKCFSYTYLVKTDKKIDEFILQEEEVSEVKYITIEKLEERIRLLDEEISFVRKACVKLILDEIKRIINL